MTDFTFFLAAIIACAADQGIKALIVGRIRNDSKSFGSAPFRFVLNPNSGRHISSPPLLVGLWMTEVMISCLLAQCEPWSHNQWAQIAFGAVVGGVTANMADQLWRGGIVDFVDLRIWPVFNIADVAIVAGALGVVMSAV